MIPHGRGRRRDGDGAITVWEKGVSAGEITRASVGVRLIHHDESKVRQEARVLPEGREDRAVEHVRVADDKPPLNERADGLVSQTGPKSLPECDTWRQKTIEEYSKRVERG